jgi:hypothetical protein
VRRRTESDILRSKANFAVVTVMREMVQGNVDRHDQTASTMAFEFRVESPEGQAMGRLGQHWWHW